MAVMRESYPSTTIHSRGNRANEMNLQGKNLVRQRNLRYRKSCAGSRGGQTRILHTLVVPGFAKNIISVGRLIKAGNKVYTEGTSMIIENPHGGNITVEQDEETCLYYLDASPVENKEAEAYNTMVENGNEVEELDEKKKKEKKKQIDINNAHELYGHVSHGILKPLLMTRGYVVVNAKKQCKACAFAKAKAKGVSKTTLLKAHEKGERLFMDISGPYKMSLKGSKY